MVHLPKTCKMKSNSTSFEIKTAWDTNVFKNGVNVCVLFLQCISILGCLEIPSSEGAFELHKGGHRGLAVVIHVSQSPCCQEGAPRTERRQSDLSSEWHCWHLLSLLLLNVCFTWPPWDEGQFLHMWPITGLCGILGEECVLKPVVF